MNQKRLSLILLIIVGVLALNACIPTATGENSSSSLIPTAASEVVSTTADPTAASEPEAAVVEESTAEQLVEVGNQAEVSHASEIIELDETWNQFTTHELGFSIKFPKEMATFRGSCTWNEDQGSYRPQMALVPVKIFEDTNAVYIAAEHFYELAGERQDGGRSYYDECNPVTNSLELLQDPDGFKEPFWKLVVEEIHDDAELDSFIKTRYFSGCSLGEQSASNQDGVYDVQIQGDGKGLDGQCPINFATVVKYFPAGGKVVAWDLGQSSHFPADVDYTVTHDLEMKDSFRFLAETATQAFGDSTESNSTGWQTYTNEAYGFSLQYPSTWTAAEVNDEDFVGPGSRSVQFSRGTVTLVIGYRRAGESVAISGSGAPGGEFEVRGTVHFAGQDVDRYVIVYEGKDKVVMYGQPGPPLLSAGGLEFASRLNDFNPDYDSVELSQAIKDDADRILSSLALIESESETSDESSEYDTTGWQTYTNEAVGYSLMIPADAQVVSPDPSDRVAFIDPEVEGKPRFQFMIIHYVPNLSEGTDFRQDLIEGHRAYLNSLGIDDEGMIEELTIAGESAIRTRHPGTSAADQPRDDFFFMHGDMMFTISINHFGGVEDSALNDQFLSSITFAP